MKRKIITITEVIIIIILVVISVKIGDFTTSSQPYIFVTKWGEKGSGNGCFVFPKSIAVDSKENVYVLDRSTSHIQKFDSYGKFITKWGRKIDDCSDLPNPRGVLKFPQDISIDSKDYVYIADYDNNRIQKFDSHGYFVSNWGEGGFAKKGHFLGPVAIEVDIHDNIYVLDDYKERLGTGKGEILFDPVQVFDTQGNFIVRWSLDDYYYKFFNHSHFIDIAIDSSDYVYVASAALSEPDPFSTPSPYYMYGEHSRISRFDSSGKLIAQWGYRDWSKETPKTYFYDISGIAIDSKDHILVAEAFKHRILVLDTDGNIITQWGSKGSWNGYFLGPIDVAVDSQDNVYVLDGGNYRVQKFKPNPKFKFSK